MQRECGCAAAVPLWKDRDKKGMQMHECEPLWKVGDKKGCGCTTAVPLWKVGK